MKKLEDLILPDSIQWIDRYDWAPVILKTERTLGGTPVIWSQPLSGGRFVTLMAEEEVTWLDQEDRGGNSGYGRPGRGIVHPDLGIRLLLCHVPA